MTDITPFRGRVINVPKPQRVIRRFTRRSGAVAEVRERQVTQFGALEWLLFVDNVLVETRLYHGARLEAYASELDQVANEMTVDGWHEVPVAQVTE